LTLNLGKNGGTEGTSHSGESELGGKSESRELGLSSVFERQGLEADEVFAAVGANGSVRNEVDRRNLRNVDAGVKRLKKRLLLSIAGVDGDLGGAKVRETRSRTTVLPLNNRLLTSVVNGRSDRCGNENGRKGGRSHRKNNDSFGEHF